MLKKMTFASLGLCFSINIFAYDIAGTWHQVDKKSQEKLTTMIITKEPDKTYSGKITKITPNSKYSAIEKCINCPSPYTNQPILGMKVLTGLKQLESGYYGNGTIIYPSVAPPEGNIFYAPFGKIYKVKAQLNNDQNQMTLRLFLGVHSIGNDQTWIRTN